MELGASDKWVYTRHHERLENFIDQIFDIEHYAQPVMVKVHVMRKWIEAAYMVGDKTVLQYNNDEPLYKPYVKYDGYTNIDIQEFQRKRSNKEVS